MPGGGPVESPVRRSAWLTVSVTVGCVVLVSLVLAWAATQGPGEVLPGPGPDLAASDTRSPVAETEDQGSAPSREELVAQHSGSTDLSWLGRLLQVAVAALILVVLARGGRALWLRWRGRHRPATGSAAAFEELPAPELVARAVADDVALQRAVLAEGSPRNGIVQCWSRLEGLGEQLGVAKRPWETSAEYTLRLLELIRADEGATHRLSDLFREARFSEHEVTEEHRRLAAGALEVIHDSLPMSGAGR